MASLLKDVHGRLRFGVGSVGLSDGSPGEVRESGVLVYNEIPVGASVLARVDRPTELPETDAGAAGSAGAVAPYAFQVAPVPPLFACGSNGAIVSNGLNRVLVANGAGALTRFGQVPVFAAFAVPQTGSLRQKGKASHFLPMPMLSAGHAIPDAARNLLRMRWTGTVQAATLLVMGDAVKKTFAGKLVNAAHKRIVPGSIVVTGTFGGNPFTARDDGNGRIIGIQVDASTPPVATLAIDGTFEYLDGAYTLKFADGAGGGAPAAAAINIAYEHSCNYIPLDVYLEWDSDAQ